MKKQFLPACFALCCIAASRACGAEASPAKANLTVSGDALVREWKPAVAPKDLPPAERTGSAVVRIVVDETGAVKSARALEASGTALGEAAVEAVRQWKFSPALDAGKPVPTCLDIPFEFSAGPPAKAGLLPPAHLQPRPPPRTPAKMKSNPLGKFPSTLNRRGLPGVVIFTCNVNADGRLAGPPQVLGASHADYVVPAMEQYASWQFEPAMKGDLPLPSTLRGQVSFDQSQVSRGEALVANGITAPDGSVPVDKPQASEAVEPIWPADLLLKGEGGTADVEFTVQFNGYVTEIQLVAASDPALGAAAMAAMESWMFNPAGRGGQMIPVRLRKHFVFTAVPPEPAAGEDALARLVRMARTGPIGGGAGLDQKLTPIYRRSPIFPAGLREEKPPGEAVIELVIDRDGRARLPRIISATRPEFGWAAATALNQWVFLPPTRQGNPTEVLVKVPVQF